MRRLALVVAMALCASFGFAIPKIAVLAPTMDKSIDSDIGSAIVDKILEQLLKSRQFNIVDRSSRDAVWEERNFQLSSGEINQTEIKSIGQGLGADYVVVVKVRKIGTLYSLSTTMIDVETLEVVAQATAEDKASVENLLSLASDCGSELVESGTEDGSLITKSSRKSSEETEADAKDAARNAEDAAYYAIKNDVRTMIHQKEFLNGAGQKRIASKIGGLSSIDRQSLYEEGRKDVGMAVIAMLVNMVPVPVPIGSIIQADWGGFWTYGILECLSLGVFSFAESEGMEEVMTVSAIVYVSAWIGSWIQPYSFNASWNSKLSRSLNVVALIGPQVVEPRLAVGRRAGMDVALVSFRY